MLSNKQKIEITIDDDDTYTMTVNYCHLPTIHSVLKDIIRKIETDEILESPDLEVYPQDSN